MDLAKSRLTCRALRAETPLLANELSEWPAWLGHPLKSELLGPGDFRLRKLQSDPAPFLRAAPMTFLTDGRP